MIPVTLSCDTGYSGQQYLVQPCTPVSSDPGNAHRTTRTTCCRTRFGSTSRMGRNGAVPSVEGYGAVRTPCRITASEFSEVGIRLTHQAPIPSMGEWKTILGT